MIDEYGNEITENRFLSLKEKAYEKRFMIISLIAIFFVTIALVQLIALISIGKKPQEIGNQNISPTITIPKSSKKLSKIATDSSFIDLQNQTASISAIIDTLDLYENSLVFPPVNTKVKIEEK